MKSYDVYFRTDLQWGMRKFVADTPEQGLELAQRFAAENPESLNLDFYEACDSEINEIEVCDEEHNSVAVWFDDDMRLRLAAQSMPGSWWSIVGNAAILPKPSANWMPPLRRRREVPNEHPEFRSYRVSLDGLQAVWVTAESRRAACDVAESLRSARRSGGFEHIEVLDEYEEGGGL